MEEGTLKRLHRVGRERLNTAISSAARKSFRRGGFFHGFAAFWDQCGTLQLQDVLSVLAWAGGTAGPRMVRLGAGFRYSTWQLRWYRSRWNQGRAWSGMAG